MLILMNFNMMCCFIFKITKSILSYTSIILGLGNYENNQPKQTNTQTKSTKQNHCLERDENNTVYP